MQIWVVRLVPWVHFLIVRRWLDSVKCFLLWISIVGWVPAVQWSQREKTRHQETLHRLDDALKQYARPAATRVGISDLGAWRAQLDDEVRARGEMLKDLDKLMNEINLKLTAHRVLVSSLLARNLVHGEDLAMLRSEILDGKLAATMSVQYGDAAQSYFDEMEHVLLIADAARQRTRPLARGNGKYPGDSMNSGSDSGMGVCI